jgi:hypothetical protein
MIKKYLDKIRKPEKNIVLSRKVLNTFSVLCFGLFMGFFSKMLDCPASINIPYPIQKIDQAIDLHNFLGGLSIWILLAVAISVYSTTPIRAGINVFFFYSGMLTSYYIYTYYVAGFFPRSYIMIWVILTLISPFLAFVCWYAKGNTNISVVISSIIIGLLFTNAFHFGIFYFYIINHGLEIIVWIASVAILYRNPKQLLKILGVSIVFALIWNFISPYRYLFLLRF